MPGWRSEGGLAFRPDPVFPAREQNSGSGLKARPRRPPPGWGLAFRPDSAFYWRDFW
jgi:hypothetical protein